MATEADTHAARQRARGFGRDLLVNVLGNLVTAAIIYLAAVVGGYIARNDVLLVASFLVVTTGGVMGLLSVLEYYFPKTTVVTNRWWLYALVGMFIGGLLVVAVSVWLVG